MAEGREKKEEESNLRKGEEGEEDEEEDEEGENDRREGREENFNGGPSKRKTSPCDSSSPFFPLSSFFFSFPFIFFLDFSQFP